MTILDRRETVVTYSTQVQLLEKLLLLIKDSVRNSSTAISIEITPIEIRYYEGK